MITHGKRGRIRSITVMIAVGTLALMGCGSGGGAESADETFEWDYAQVVPLGHPMSDLAVAFAEDVEKETDGRLKINVVPLGETPYNSDEYNRRVGEGSLDMAQAQGSFISGDCDAINVWTLPFVVESYEDFDAAVPAVAEEIEAECFTPHGSKTLYVQPWIFTFLLGEGEPVTALDQITGMTVRQNGVMDGAVLSQLGAKTETILTAEVPGALERGVIQAAISSNMTANGAGWGDLLDWGYRLYGGGFAIANIVVNEEAYDALPDEVRSGLDRAVEKAAARDREQSPQAELDSQAALEELDIVFNDPSSADLKKAHAIGEDIRKEWVAQHPEQEDLVGKLVDALGK